jgi:2-methylcitrate dehydratase PrpD
MPFWDSAWLSSGGGAGRGCQRLVLVTLKCGNAFVGNNNNAKMKGSGDVTISEEISQFVFNLKYEELPDPVIEKAKACIADCIAVTIAGLETAVSGLVSSYVKDAGGSPLATVVGRDWKTSPVNAALANGTTAHALDYDDYNSKSNGSMAHPSAVIWPAVFAVGESTGANGRLAITAYVAGTQVEGKIGSGVNPALYRKGWHSTSVLGVIGSALAAGKVMGLPVEALVRSCGIAASMACGLRCNFGTMTKPFHAGHAASAGILAASLAQRGMTAEPRAIEAEAGFCRAFLGDNEFDLKKMVVSLRGPWDLIEPGVHLKRHACNAAVHPAIDAMLMLRSRVQIEPNQVAKINVGLTPMAKKELIHDNPITSLEAKFSAQYCVAIALLDGKAGIDQFKEEELNRPEVKELVRKTTVESHPDLSVSGYHEDPKAIVEVYLKDGERLAQRIDLPKGHSKNPLSREEMKEKFLECTKRRWPRERMEDLFEELFVLERLASLDKLARKMSG